ncbi:MAG: YhcH/YjgK/YiaL family protein [Clostridium perfringens]|nr:YhcH/YjgK/YiaL family protein [Clostridium perfringens]
MILENVKFAKDYSEINPNLEKAIEFLKSNDLNSLEVGNYEIDGKNVYAFVQEYESHPVEERRWEAHKKYIDIQCIIAGNEVMYYAPVDSLEMYENNFEEKDVAFFKNVEHSTRLELTNGDYAIFFPEDAHKPCCALDKPEHVKKIVVKVKVQ